MRASIIIASHQEGDLLYKTVDSCVETCAGLDCEIIVSDDASTDGSIDRVAKHWPQVRVIRHETRQGASPAKASGASSARGDVLVFLDGHTKPEQDAIRRLIEGVEALEGQAILTPAVPSLDTARWRNLESPVGHGYYLDLQTFDSGWLGLDRMTAVVEQGRR